MLEMFQGFYMHCTLNPYKNPTTAYQTEATFSAKKQDPGDINYLLAVLRETLRFLDGLCTVVESTKPVVSKLFGTGYHGK